MSEAPRRTPGSVVAIGLVTWAIVQGIAAYFETNASASVVLQALAAELGAGRAGVAWTTRSQPPPIRRVAVGALGGIAFSAVVLVLGAALGKVHVAGGPFSIATLFVGAAVAVAGAVRDELLLRGVVMRAFAGRVPVAVLLAAAGLVAVAAEPTLDAGALFRFGAGIALAAVWKVDGGAFMAVAANAGARFAAGPLVTGGLLDLRFDAGLFSGRAGLLSSPAAGALALALAGGLALRAFRAYRSPA